MAMGKKIRERNKKKSVSEMILELGDFLKSPKPAEEIKKEIKHNKGHIISIQDIRVNLLYLLRRDEVKRKKEGAFYKYYV